MSKELGHDSHHHYHQFFTKFLNSETLVCWLHYQDKCNMSSHLKTNSKPSIHGNSCGGVGDHKLTKRKGLHTPLARPMLRTMSSTSPLVFMKKPRTNAFWWTILHVVATIIIPMILLTHAILITTKSTTTTT